jgi:hypothetical protein
LKVAATYILTVEAGKEAKNDDFWAQSQRAKERGWSVLQLTADHNAQWSAPEALVEMLAGIVGKKSRLNKLRTVTMLRRRLAHCERYSLA